MHCRVSGKPSTMRQEDKEKPTRPLEDAHSRAEVMGATAKLDATIRQRRLRQRTVHVLPSNEERTTFNDDAFLVNQ